MGQNGWEKLLAGEDFKKVCILGHPNELSSKTRFLDKFLFNRKEKILGWPQVIFKKRVSSEQVLQKSYLSLKEKGQCLFDSGMACKGKTDMLIEY